MKPFDWKAREPNTLRSYAVAVKDFETVTGLRVDRADTASLSIWRQSMEGRGLAINTIRARLSAVSVVSAVKIELPKPNPQAVAELYDRLILFTGMREMKRTKKQKPSSRGVQGKEAYHHLKEQ